MKTIFLDSSPYSINVPLPYLILVNSKVYVDDDKDDKLEDWIQVTVIILSDVNSNDLSAYSTDEYLIMLLVPLYDEELYSHELISQAYANYIYNHQDEYGLTDDILNSMYLYSPSGTCPYIKLDIKDGETNILIKMDENSEIGVL